MSINRSEVLEYILEIISKLGKHIDVKVDPTILDKSLFSPETNMNAIEGLLLNKLLADKYNCTLDDLYIDSGKVTINTITGKVIDILNKA